MSGGVILWDYDRDGWLDIYFTNAPTIEMALRKESARGALYHNNHNGTFSDATDKSGLAAPCFAMGGAVADYNNDGWPDLYLTCLGGNVLFRNNGDGTFTYVTAKAGVADGRMSVGAAFGDYDRDGFVDLMVANYVDFQLDHLPPFGGKSLCKYRGIDVYCGPRGLPKPSFRSVVPCGDEIQIGQRSDRTARQQTSGSRPTQSSTDVQPRRPSEGRLAPAARPKDRS